MGGSSLLALRDFKESKLQELDLTAKGVSAAAVAEVQLIVLSTPTFTAKHAEGWCAAAGPLIDWARAVADYRGALDRSERRAEDEARAAAEAAEAKALEELHRRQESEGRLELQVWDEVRT